MAVRVVVFKIFAVVIPLVALITVWPMVKEMPPFAAPSNFNSIQILLVVPFYLGLLAGPGYLYALLSKERVSSRMVTLWKRWSLNVAIMASIGGLTTALAVIPFPFVLGSLILSILLRRDLELSTV